MTTPEPTPAPEAPAVPPEIATEASAAAEDTDAPISLEAAKKLRSEAAQLRARAKAAEESSEALLARIHNLEQAQVREYASEILHDPADLLAAHPDAVEFWEDEFSGVTRNRVVDAAKALAAEKPWLLKSSTPAPPPSDRPIEGLRPGARAAEPVAETTWAQALRG